MSKDLKSKPAEEEVVETATEEVAEKPYTLRALYDEDIYTVIEILGKALPEEAKEAFVQAVTDQNGKKKPLEILGGLIGFDIVRIILKNLKDIKEEVYAFLSDLSGIPAEDIRKMPFGTTPKMLKEVFGSKENADFFKELFKSL